MSARTSTGASKAASVPSWCWPIAADRYDRRGRLTPTELAALRGLGLDDLRSLDRAGLPEWQAIGRLVVPLGDAQSALHWHPDTRHQRRFARDAAALVLVHCAQLERAFWSWTPLDWVELIGDGAAQLREDWPGQVGSSARPYLLAYAYLLAGFTAFDQIGRFHRLSLTWRVFGRELVDDTISQVHDLLASWGYRRGAAEITATICQTLLLNRSPLLTDLSADTLTRLRTDPAMGAHLPRVLHGIHRAVAALGHAEPPAAPKYGDGPAVITGTAIAWAHWVERWYATSTLEQGTRTIYRSVLAKIGRWLAAEHPEITEPGQWTRQTCAAWVAAVDRMTVGDHTQWQAGQRARLGKPLSPRTKSSYLRMARAFFRDLQEWEWIPRRFDAAHALSTPRSIRALLGPDPRVIADDIWAKLLWAGLNLDASDAEGHTHPVEMIRAITLAWLFAGQRSDEIARLRVGCIRWQHNGLPIAGDTADVLARDAVCLLDVPTHKTGTAFTKPVDPLLGQAIAAWQAIRPAQPKLLDRKTGEYVDLLFAIRAGRVDKRYINEKIIPMLCRKAGIPTRDVRGNITSHRARSTIASQLYNAKEPMTLFELQEWLGHRSIVATQFYAKLTPNTLARAYRDAGYFARNLRTIEVLLDRDAVTSGAAAAGEPWQYYDLGHGWCTYNFFEQCPHRMACARCDFYAPKPSIKGQLLDAKTNLQKMLLTIPLTDDERAAVDDGQAALDTLLDRLADTPTPAGPTPRQSGAPRTVTLLPIIDISAKSPPST